jgi:hypothetical protein
VIEVSSFGKDACALGATALVYDQIQAQGDSDYRGGEQPRHGSACDLANFVLALFLSDKQTAWKKAW